MGKHRIVGRWSARVSAPRWAWFVYTTAVAIHGGALGWLHGRGALDGYILVWVGVVWLAAELVIIPLAVWSNRKATEWFIRRAEEIERDSEH